MEKDLKDSVASEHNESESAPLLPPRVHVQVLIKKGDEIFSVKKTSLSNLSSEMSGLSLKASSQATTKPVDDEPTVHQQEITESPTVESGDHSEDAVEDMSVDEVLDEVDQVLGDPVDQILDVSSPPPPPSNSPVPSVDKLLDKVDRVEEDTVDQVLGEATLPPPSSSPVLSVNTLCGTESQNRRWLDRTMCMLILEIILMGFPISMAYYGITYFQHCQGGDKLPTLLLILAFLSASTLFSRILINCAKIGGFCCGPRSYDRDIVPPMIICAGDFLVVVLFIAEFVYIFTMNSALCNEDFYNYVFYMNITAAFCIFVLIFCIIIKLVRCIRILRE